MTSTRLGQLISAAMDEMPSGRRDVRLSRWIRAPHTIIDDLADHAPEPLHRIADDLRDAEISRDTWREALGVYYKTSPPMRGLFGTAPHMVLADRALLRAYHHVTDGEIFAAGVETLLQKHENAS